MINFPQGFDALVPIMISFMLVATRLGFLMLSAPIFGSKAIPRKTRLAMLLTVSFAVFMSLPDAGTPPMDVPTLILAMLGEAAIGAAAGLTAQVAMATVETAGQMVGIPMGLGFSGAIDPMTGDNSVVTSRFLGMIATFILLVLNIHHVLLGLITKSFVVIPPGQATISPVAANTLVRSATMIFDGAIRLASPVLIVLLGVMATLGLLAKVAPKINLLVLSFAISIGLGLITLRSALPDMGVWIRGVILKIAPMTERVLEDFV